MKRSKFSEEQIIGILREADEDLADEIVAAAKAEDYAVSEFIQSAPFSSK